MASSYTGLSKAEADVGQYKKVRKFWCVEGGVDCSSGGKFVAVCAVVGGVTNATACADVFGIILDGVASGASTFVDVYCGLQDLFEGVISTAANGTSAILDGALVYAMTNQVLGTAIASVDAVGILADNTGLTGASGNDGTRVKFQLTPSQAIPGYDSGNVS